MKAPIFIVKQLLRYADLVAYVDYAKYEVQDVNNRGIILSMIESPNGKVEEGFEGFIPARDVSEECIVTNNKITFSYNDYDTGEDIDVIIKDKQGQNILQLLTA